MSHNSQQRTHVIRLVNHLPVSKLTKCLLKVIKIFQADLARSYSLQEIADIANVCPRQLERIFQKATQLSPLQYHKRLRLEAAADLLVTEDWEIKCVGLEVGYKDASRFSEDFKKLYGKTPQQHREEAGHRV